MTLAQMWMSLLAQPAASDHLVKLYDAPGQLIQAVSAYLGAGLAAGDGMLVVATPQHAALVLEALAERGISTRQAQSTGQLVILDAAATLARISGPRGPDRERFVAVIEPALASCLSASRSGQVRAFGEMVELLSREGRSKDALELEDLWNRTLVRCRFSLLCAYDIGNFARSADQEMFSSMCHAHSHVDPVCSLESETGAAETARRIAVLEQQARSLRAEIDEREAVEARLHQSQAELLQARKMEALGRLAGGIAHDFNNLLQVVDGHLELVLDAGLPTPDRTAAADEMRRAVEKARGVTRQLLALSSRQVLQPRRVDVNEITSAMHQLLRRLIGGHVEFLLELDPEAGCVNADPSQLEQVVLNLVLNARDAVGARGHIWLRTRCADVEPGAEAGACRQVVLEVADDGAGMDEDVQARMYEPFFTTKPAGQGSGLGLATVFGIVRQSGGRLQVDSAPGKGARFRVLLPWVPPSARVLAPDPAIAVRPGKALVLVVEDEPAVRRIAVGALRRQGHTVLDAGDAATALRLAEGVQLDALVTDVVMPGRNGLELARLLRERQPDLAVLFISGYADGLVDEISLDDDRTMFLAKPFSPSVLAHALEEIRSMLRKRAS